MLSCLILLVLILFPFYGKAGAKHAGTSASNRPSSLPAGNRPSSLPASNRPSSLPAGNRPSSLPAGTPAGSRPSSLPAGTPAELKCEYLVSPLGIDAPHPRLSWMQADERMGAGQRAYNVVAGTDSMLVVKGKGTWETGKISSAINRIIYTGTALQPYTRYFWKVMVWDHTGKSSRTSAIASFETGLMEMKNWKGFWVSDGTDVNTKPAALFRKAFIASSGKQLKSARAYIAAAGLYELYLNGKKIGDHRLDPMYTRYDRRNLYVSYDVTADIVSGVNAAGVILGNGWYNFQSLGVWDFEKAPWRNRPAFCMDLRLTYTDGTVETVSTNETWKTSLGPVVYNSIYTGEQYDARLEQDGWNKTGFDDSKWKTASNRQAPSQNIVSQAMEPVRNVEKVQSQGMKKLNDSTYLFDLGRNIAGVSQITLNGAAGTIVRLVHAERLDKNGRADQSNVDYFLAKKTRDLDPFATDIYTLNGKGPETFMPRFNYKGFQYVEVHSNKPITLTRESLCGWFMHSDVEAAGSIHTSSDLINKIWAATNASYLSNLMGYPTDCPQREKNGWTGDAHIASETGLYNFDGVTVYEKWMADHRDEQQPNGVLPSIVPTDGWGYEWGNGPDWTSTIAIIPWNIYLFYGDAHLLGNCYGNIRRYVDHISELYPTGLTTWGLGDWAPVKSTTPVELTSSVYYYADVTILAKAARILGNKADYITYTALAEKIKKAVNDKYLNRETGVYADGNQTEQSVPLYWGLVPDSLKARAGAHLAASVAATNFHLDVGIIGAKAILNALSENGQAETAFRLASQNTFPSWGWWIDNGATTLYENWNIESKRDLSLNHIMFGEIGAWLYKGIGGIKPDERQPGFKNVLLSPNFVSGLDHFESSHISPYGTVSSSWKRVGGVLSYEVTVPANSTASIIFPELEGRNIYLNGSRLVTTTPCKVGAGTYIFILK